VCLQGTTPVNFLLMQNSAQVGSKIESIFDLKGSIINRVVDQKTVLEGSTMKDVNLLNLKKENCFLMFQEKDQRRHLDNILKDITFLARFRLMDYSLLLIVETNPNWVQKIRASLLQKRKLS
jgi:hypothetical protein